MDEHYVRAYPTACSDRFLFIESQERSTWEEIDNGSHPADVTLESPGIWRVYELGRVHCPSRFVKSTEFFPYSSCSPTFEQYLAELDEWEASLLQHVELFVDPFSMESSISYGLKAVSDGSVWIKRMGAFGWAISDAHGERLHQKVGFVKVTKHFARLLFSG